jgi:outer membrane protein assembly factor BamD
MRTGAGGWGRGALYALIIPLTLVLSASCSSTSKNKSAPKGVVATDEQIFIGDTVEKNYDPNVIIKRAESFFDKEEYAEAIIEYQHFLDLHRVHTLAPYAQFKLSESHFKMAKTIDRDMEPVRKALEGYEKLLKDFPGNKWQTEANDRIRACHDYLAQSAYFVGKYYLRQDAFLAAAKRFESVVKQYPELDVASDAMFDLARTYHEIGADDWAQERLFALEQQYPNHKHKAESQRLYAALKSTLPLTAVARADRQPPPVTLAASAVPVALGAANGVPAVPLPPLSPAGLSLTNGSTPQSYSDGTYRRPAAPRESTDVPMTLAISTAPASTTGMASAAASLTTTLADSAFAPAVTVCRLGSWC